MVLPVTTEAVLAQAAPRTAKISKRMMAMLLAAMTVALMWPSTAVCTACATPQSAPLRNIGVEVLT